MNPTLHTPSTPKSTLAPPTTGTVLILGALMAIGPFSIDMYLPALPTLGNDLGASAAAAQQTVAAYFIGNASGQLIYGPLSDRIGRRRPLLFGTALYVLAALGCAFAPGIVALCAFRVLQALGACAGMVICRAIVRDRFQPEDVLHVYALMYAVMSISPIVAPLAGGWLLFVLNWRGLFVIQAAAGLMVALAVFFTIPESRSATTAQQARSESPFAAYLALLRQPQLIGFMCLGACAGAALFVWVAAAPDIVIRIFGVPPHHFGYVFGANALGLVLATQINARIARRYGSELILTRATLFAFIVSLALVFCAITGSGGAWGVLVPMFLIISTMGFTQSNAQAGAINVDPTRSGSTASLIGFVTSFAGSGAAALTGVFRDGTARPTAFVISASLLLAIACVALVKRNARAATEQ